jgi:diguanylate cyclase (GGDEF)-like protein
MTGQDRPGAITLPPDETVAAAGPVDGPLHRILVIEDDPAVTASYRSTLRGLVPEPDKDAGAGPDDLARDLFGAEPVEDGVEMRIVEDVTYCSQGLDGVRAVEESLASGAPFSVAFIDIRMPPGIDGLETAVRIRALDPRINIVIVTGYSDHARATITNLVPPPDKLFYLSKPFAPAEIQRLTLALTSKWRFEASLELANEALAARCAELERTNTALAASEARAIHVARHDSVAGLPNRLALLEQLDRAIWLARADESRCAVIYLDLDRFKDVNDALGHSAGDDLIRQVGARIMALAGPSAFVARLGGDEFAVIHSRAAEAEALGQRLIDSFDAPFVLWEGEVTVGASIGVALLDDDRTEAVEMLRRADIALYVSKKLGRGRYQVFSAWMDEGIGFRHKLVGDLKAAMNNGELELHYQPQVTADGDRISGLEALCRWTRADGSMVSPAMFIPVAEESSLIRHLGEWVLERAMADARRWPDMTVAINLSPVQFLHNDLAGRILAIATEAQVDPSRIELEITENVLIDDVDAALANLTRLKDFGFRLALDDFGTGYASINYLRRFPFDKLKIDRSFILDIGGGADTMRIVHAIVDLARALGVSVTVEGVETTAQHLLLRAAGCTQMQGFLFHHAMPAADVDRLLGIGRLHSLTA